MFPGKSSNEQIELIISILGTPKLDDIYKDDRLKSKDSIFKYGKIDKVSWKEIFPSACPDALDLLDKMLIFDPDRRITAEKALKHKYFDDLPHSEDEIPDPVSKFDFEFEEIELDILNMRDLILHEIMLYHDQKLLDEYEKLKEMYRKNIKLSKKKNFDERNGSIGVLSTVPSNEEELNTIMNSQKKLKTKTKTKTLEGTEKKVVKKHTKNESINSNKSAFSKASKVSSKK